MSSAKNSNSVLPTFGIIAFELCLGYNSETIRNIPFCVQTLFAEHHPVQPVIVFIGRGRDLFLKFSRKEVFAKVRKKL
jgi:hypothetical protein